MKAVAPYFLVIFLVVLSPVFGGEDKRMDWGQIMDGVQVQQQADPYPLSNTEFREPIKPGQGTKYVTGDPALADLAEPGVKHAPLPTDPELGELGRGNVAGRSDTPTKIDPNAAPRAGSGTKTTLSQPGNTPNMGQGTPTRVRTPSSTTTKISQPGNVPNMGQGSATKVTTPTGSGGGGGKPSLTEMPGRVAPGSKVKYVSGDPGLADLADPGWKHVKGPTDPKLGELVTGGGKGGKPPSGGGGKSPTKLGTGSGGPNMGEGSVTRAPGGGRKQTSLTEGKSSFAPEQPVKQSVAESVASGVAVAGAIAEPMTMEMGSALQEDRDVNLGTIGYQASGLGAYDTGKQQAQQELDKYHAGEQSKVEAFGNAVLGTADQMLFEPVREIVRENLNAMESEAERTGQRPTMVDGMGTYVNMMGETVGHMTGVRALFNAAAETQNYDEYGNAIATEKELGQTIDRNLTAGERDINNLQNQIEDLINNGDTSDPATAQQLQTLLDDYDTAYDRMQNIQAVTDRAGDKDRKNNVNATVNGMVDSETMRGYADDIYTQRGGDLSAAQAASQAQQQQGGQQGQEGQSADPGRYSADNINDLVRQSGDSSLTQGERDAATLELTNILDELKSSASSDGGKGGGGGEDDGKKEGLTGTGPGDGGKDPGTGGKPGTGDEPGDDGTKVTGGGQETGGKPGTGDEPGTGGTEVTGGKPGEDDGRSLEDIVNDPSTVFIPSIFTDYNVTTVDELTEQLTLGVLTGELTPQEVLDLMTSIAEFNANVKNGVNDELGTGSSGQNADANTSDDDEFADFVQDLLTTANDDKSDDDSGGTGDLRDSEGDAGGDYDQYAQGPSSGDSPLGSFVNNSSAHTDRDLDYGGMEIQQEVTEATTTGDDDVCQAGLVRDQGGHDAQDINQESTSEVAQGDSNNSWGNVIGDSIASGIVVGATTAMETMGAAAADEVADQVYGGSSENENDSDGDSAAGAEVASAASSGGSAGGSSGGGSSGGHSHPDGSTDGGVRSGGSSGGGTVRTTTAVAPVCANCGRTKIKCSDGVWRCPNSAWVKNNSGSSGGSSGSSGGLVNTFGPMLNSSSSGGSSSGTRTTSGGKPASGGTKYPTSGGKPASSGTKYTTSGGSASGY